MDSEGKKEEGKTKMAQGLGYLQKYVEKGPDGQLKTESKGHHVQPVLCLCNGVVRTGAGRIATVTSRGNCL